MLALLAALMLTKSGALPDPFLTNELEPILPVAALAGQPRARVARGAFWWTGGYTRVSYFYRFESGSGPGISEILKEPDFLMQEFPMGSMPGPRAIRTKDGIRQVVSSAELKPETYWRWADLKGPAKVIVVTETPIEGEVVKKWHTTPELLRPPLPPSFPPEFQFLMGSTVYSVNSDPIIPRSPRASFWIVVRLTNPRSVVTLSDLARRELGPEWKITSHATGWKMERKDAQFGLTAIELSTSPGESPASGSSVILATYWYSDPLNAPRLAD